MRNLQSQKMFKFANVQVLKIIYILKIKILTKRNKNWFLNIKILKLPDFKKPNLKIFHLLKNVKSKSIKINGKNK
jgi:hypothetical protein